jgi:hypothetical protein
MKGMLGLNFGLDSMPLFSDMVTRSISAEDPMGEPGGGSSATLDGSQPGPVSSQHAAIHAAPDWRAQPCLENLIPGQTVKLPDIEGPGVIQQIWMAAPNVAYRTCTLRMHWDGEDAPSVEVPHGDLFANMHGFSYDVYSLPTAANPSGGFNSHWPMPFQGRPASPSSVSTGSPAQPCSTRTPMRWESFSRK